MASTDLMTYLHYMATWEAESAKNIDSLISEHNQFVRLGDFSSDSVVDSEFDTLNRLACEVRDLTIAADATEMAADVAAIAAIWTFGLGMGAFVALQIAAKIEHGVVSNKSTALNLKLTTADIDISERISDSVKNYIAIFKSNNSLIASKAPVGSDTRTCRGNLLQFMAQVERKTTLNAENFKKYAASARHVYNSTEINAVYDALDELNLSQRTDADVRQFMNVLASLDLEPTGLSLVRNVSVGIMVNRLRLARTMIRTAAQDAGIPLEEVTETAFGRMTAAGKFIAALAIVTSVADMILQVIDIVNVVEQCAKMCDQLNGPIRASYKSYFNQIKVAAAEYKAAIAAAPDRYDLAPVSGLYLTTQATSGTTGIWRFDQTTGAAPTQVPGTKPYGFRNLARVGDILYFTTDGPDGIWAYGPGVSNGPGAKSQTSGLRFRGLTAIGDTLYLTTQGGDGIWTYNVAAGGVASQIPSTNGYGFRSAVAIGPILYLTAQGPDGIWIFDTGSRGGPAPIGQTARLKFEGMIAVDNLLFMTTQPGSSRNGIWVMDTNKPAAPTQIRSTAAYGFRNIARIGTTLYLTTQGSEGIWTFDTVARGAPTQIPATAGFAFAGITPFLGTTTHPS